MPTAPAVLPQLEVNAHDPRVIAARQAERELFEVYQLQPQERELSTPFGRLRVLTFGSGPPLLLVPGNTGDVFPLVPLIAQLKGHTVIAVNRPGGGLSEGMDHRLVDIRRFAVDTLTRVLDAFDLGPVPVVAHSMGAHWSLWLSIDEPKRVSRLVTMGNPGNVLLDKPPLLLKLLGRPPFNRWMIKLVSPRSPHGAGRLFRMMGTNDETFRQLPAALLQSYIRFWNLPNYLTSATSLMENGPPRLGETDLQRVRQPVLMLWGTRDTFANVDKARQIAAALPNARLSIIDGASHLPWLEAAPACGKQILDFLAAPAP